MLNLINGISVIICCYNSEERISETVNCLFKQKNVDKIQYDIIIVDNKCTDRTLDIVKQNYNKSNLSIPIKIVSEEKPGLSYARKRGVYASENKYVIFCDDDNHLSDKYVSIAYEIMETNKEIGALGGTAIPILEENLIEPDWFKDYHIIYACGKQGPGVNADISKSKSYVYGAGSVYQTEILLSIYNSQIELLLTDRIGKSLVAGGDNELGYLVTFMGFKIFWSDKLLLYHKIPSSRISIDYIKKINIGLANTFDIVSMYKAFVNGNCYNYFSIFVSLLRFLLIFIYISVANKTGSINIQRKTKFILLYTFHTTRLLNSWNIVFNFRTKKKSIIKNFY